MTTSERSRAAQRGLATEPPDRSALMQEHAAARARRDAAQLGTDEFRAAAEDVARIEVAIAELEEPPPQVPTTTR